jgi:hypothetical protein
MSRARNYFFTLIVAALVTGCGLIGGTEAGNPTIGQSMNNQPVPGQYSQYLLDTVCTKYHECFPAASTTNCGTGVLAQTNLPQGFGLAAGFGTAFDMVNAERAGTIKADYAHVVSCADDVRAISCISPTATSAAPVGSPNTTTAYTGVINMIPTSGTSCAGVF